MTSDRDDAGASIAPAYDALSSAARRLTDLVAVAEAPVHYEVLRHLLRVSEETMTEVLQEAVGAGLIRRGDDAFTYVPAGTAVASELLAAIGEDRAAKLRTQVGAAAARVFE